ncbi:conserved hypothetical protein [Ricinus communis]|uniref:Uncharacterized protein n=1 Tax=Ricinus communis TaxID=3988 RepID=B9RHG0_RICCO|nr:conserved hypothetical protein [Ricinus communis]
MPKRPKNVGIKNGHMPTTPTTSNITTVAIVNRLVLGGVFLNNRGTGAYVPIGQGIDRRKSRGRGVSMFVANVDGTSQGSISAISNAVERAKGRGRGRGRGRDKSARLSE